MIHWQIHKSSQTGSNLLQHFIRESPCGFACKVKETGTFHCWTCGTEVPPHYVDVMYLGKIYILHLDLWDCHWDVKSTIKTSSK